MRGIQLPLSQTQKLRLQKVLDQLESLSSKVNSDTSVTMADSIPVNHEDGVLKGHRTADLNGELFATFCGGVKRVNKLVYVRALRSRFTPEVGDVVIGRVVERRRTAVDELHMHSIFEGKDVCAEVCGFQHDGLHLQARSKKYGKVCSLENLVRMKRVWRFSSDTVQAKSLSSQFNGICFSSKSKAIPPFTTALFTRQVNTLSNKFPDIVSLFTAKPGPPPKEDLTTKAMILSIELVQEASDSVRVRKILDMNADFLNQPQPGGSVFLELLNQLDSWPSLALQVFNWIRRNGSDAFTPMNAYVYSKGIKLAGRSRNIDLAVEIFNEAANKGVKTTSTYNALMSAFVFNGLAHRCQSLFVDMKKDATCHPSIATYNILISVFGRLMLIDYMEATLQEINQLDLSPNVCTYNYLIAGYIAAWMWDDMEKIFQMLKTSSVEPDLKTYLLMIRGYALAGNLEKMEEIYSLVRDYVNKKEIPLIRTMICAYCRSSEADRVKKIGELLKLIPEGDYRPWLNVLLIKLYAQEDWLEEMEIAINEAFEHRTLVITVGIMRCIIATYFRCNALEKLEIFVRRAEIAGWRICHSLYHCKLVMYSSGKQFKKMHNVLKEMNGANLYGNKKTLWIMYKAYLSCGQRSMVLKILGQMFKHGYEVPLEAFPS